MLLQNSMFGCVLSCPCFERAFQVLAPSVWTRCLLVFAHPDDGDPPPD